MELKEENRFLRKSEELPEQNFTIKASAKAFSILSNQLYTNKARAIIRELSCNAIDAQVAAGQQSKKFDLQLPNNTNPTFRIRDYGTGISPEDIITVYTKYFESTKTTSNAFIGALGLGSKTPFCYTDNFQVASFFNGKKYSYAAFINDDGMPCVSLISTDNTTEPNGLEVSFAVQQKDHAIFKTEAEYVLFWFKAENRPNVIGQKLNIAKLDVALMGEAEVDGQKVQWKTVRIPQFWNGPGLGAHVIMGAVSYKVDRSTFAQLDTAQQAALSLNLHMEVPIGAIEVQASREALSLNKSTILFIKRALTAIAAQARASYEKELDLCPTFWDACIYRYEKVAHLDKELRCIVEASPLMYKGQQLVRSLRNEQPGGGYKSFLVFNRDVSAQTGDSVSKKDWDNDVEPRRNVAFVVVPKEWKEAKIRAWCRRNDKGFTKVVVLEDEALAKKNNISDGYCFQYDDLPEPARDKSGRQGLTGKKKDQIYVFDFKDKFARAFTSLVSVDFENDAGIYVKAKFKKPYIGNNETTLTILSNVVELYNVLVPADKKITKIFGLTETQVKEIDDNDEWQELSSVISEFTQEQLADSSLIEFVKAIKLSTLNNQSILAKVNNPVFTELKMQLAKHPINEFFEVLQSHNTKAKNLRGKYESVDKFLRDHSVNRVVDSLATKVQTIVDAPAQVEYTKELLNLQTKEQALFDKFPILMLFATPRKVQHSHAQVAKVLSQSF